MPAGEEGQIWTAGSDGAGSWQTPASGAGVKYGFIDVLIGYKGVRLSAFDIWNYSYGSGKYNYYFTSKFAQALGTKEDLYVEGFSIATAKSAAFPGNMETSYYDNATGNSGSAYYVNVSAITDEEWRSIISNILTIRGNISATVEVCLHGPLYNPANQAASLLDEVNFPKLSITIESGVVTDYSIISTGIGKVYMTSTGKYEPYSKLTNVVLH